MATVSLKLWTASDNKDKLPERIPPTISARVMVAFSTVTQNIFWPDKVETSWVCPPLNECGSEHNHDCAQTLLFTPINQKPFHSHTET